MRKTSIFQILFLIVFSINITSCISTSFFKNDGTLEKNWDTVNRTLDFYKKKSIDEIMADFGDNYEPSENTYRFFSPTEESSVTFVVKKDKVKSYSYDGLYSDILLYLENLPSMKESELQTAANMWLGFSPDLLKNTFGTLICKSTDKIIYAGASESVCVEFSIKLYSQPDGTTSASTSEKKYYISKAIVKGSYDELKDYLVPVPKDSVQVKKIKQKN